MYIVHNLAIRCTLKEDIANVINIHHRKLYRKLIYSIYSMNMQTLLLGTFLLCRDPRMHASCFIHLFLKTTKKKHCGPSTKGSRP